MAKRQYAANWDFWIDRGGTFTDVVGAAAGRLAARAQAAVGKPGGLCAMRPCRASATCSACKAGRSHPAGPRRRREDGHHGRHQCAARAQGRPHAAADHQGFPRRAEDRLPGAAEDLRQAHRQARTCCTSAWRKSTSACCADGTVEREPDLGAVRADLEAAQARRHRRRRDRVHARLPLPRARDSASPRSRARWASRRFR